MFITKNKVRMHDTDMAGILYFPRQFRFAHDALEDMVESEGLGFDQMFTREDFVIVIVHAESDYITPLRVGDSLEIHVGVERIGTSSFTVHYQIFKADKTLTGTAKTVHVTLDRKTRKKVPIPEKARKMLMKYALENVEIV